MSVNHYENFPVGSVLLPKRLRQPVHAIYHFARTADDYADEGNASNEERLASLAGLSQELDIITAGKTPQTPLMQKLNQEAIQPYSLPLASFYDLLSAFSQDVVTKRYQTFDELVDYCRRSANPVGTLLLHLYGVTGKEHFAMSDAICSALQLINFWQDVAVDWQKNRVYIPQEDLIQFNVSETNIANGNINDNFRSLLKFECDRARTIMLSGAPLGRYLKGRIGFELRMIIQGGLCILDKLEQNRYDVFNHRPVLGWRDWILLTYNAAKF
jgi:squalene synthase HpnC